MRQDEPLFALISYRTWHNMAKDIAMYLLNQYILSPLSSYCPSPGLVLSKSCHRIVQTLSSYCLSSHVVFFICSCCDKNTLLKTKISYVFLFLKSFRYICDIVPQLQRWYGMTLSKRCY